jgi:hypothetical protein
MGRAWAPEVAARRDCCRRTGSSKAQIAPGPPDCSRTGPRPAHDSQSFFKTLQATSLWRVSQKAVSTSSVSTVAGTGWRCESSDSASRDARGRGGWRAPRTVAVPITRVAPRPNEIEGFVDGLARALKGLAVVPSLHICPSDDPPGLEREADGPIQVGIFQVTIERVPHARGLRAHQILRGLPHQTDRPLHRVGGLLALLRVPPRRAPGRSSFACLIAESRRTTASFSSSCGMKGRYPLWRTSGWAGRTLDRPEGHHVRSRSIRTHLPATSAKRSAARKRLSSAPRPSRLRVPSAGRPLGSRKLSDWDSEDKERLLGRGPGQWEAGAA